MKKLTFWKRRLFSGYYENIGSVVADRIKLGVLELGF